MNIEDDEETREAMRNLVLLVASLTFCGHTDLKLSATGNKYSSACSFTRHFFPIDVKSQTDFFWFCNIAYHNHINQYIS